jgi:hypothetical protein
MKKFGILLILAVVISSSLAPVAFAVCENCGVAPADQDWASSAANFMEGKPIDDTPSDLSNAQQYRLRNTEFNSSLLGGSSGQGSNQASNPAVSNAPASTAAVTPMNTPTSSLNISLKDISAMPNPANTGSPVMITAAFGNNSSNSQSFPETNITAYATIKNAAGVEVGKVNLEHTSGEEYAGIWNADVAAGTYKATIDASGSGGSKTFNDALQIVLNRL